MKKKPSITELVDTASLEKRPVIKADPEKALREIEKWVAAMDGRLEITYQDCGGYWEIHIILENDEIAELPIFADIKRWMNSFGMQRPANCKPVRYTQKQVEAAVRIGLGRLITKRKNIRLFLIHDRKGKEEVEQVDHCDSLTENGLGKDFP